MADKSSGGGFGISLQTNNTNKKKSVVQPKEEPVVQKLDTDIGLSKIAVGEDFFRTVVDIPKVNEATKSYIMSLQRLFEKKKIEFWNNHTDLKGFIQSRLPTELQLSTFSLLVELSILYSNSIPKKIVDLSQRYIEVVRTENEKLHEAVSNTRLKTIIDKCDTNITIAGDIEAEARKYIQPTGGKKKSRKSKKRNVNKSKKYRKKY